MRQAAPRVLAVQTAERNGRHSHLIAIGPRQESEPEYLESMQRGHAIEILVNRAHQHLTPESLDRAFCLVVLAKPPQHRDAAEIVARAVFTAEREQSSRDRKLVAGAQEFQTRERSAEMKRGGEMTGAQRGHPAAGLDEVEICVEFDVIFNAEPPVKVQQVDAAPQQDVLAVVDRFRSFARCGDLVRCRATAEKRARFE